MQSGRRRIDVHRAIERQASPSRQEEAGRIQLLDAWRGAAIVGVVLYHVGWDLSFFGFAPPGMMFSQPMILFARTLVSSFMFLCGVGIVLAHEPVFDGRSFWKRFLKIALAAVAITGVSLLSMPSDFVYFGVLHAIAASSLIGLAFIRMPVPIVAVAGFLVIALSFFIRIDDFGVRWLAWIGFAALPPPSIDFVPLFPWLGVTLLGVAATKLFLRWPATSKFFRVPVPRWLSWAGRRTLPIYLLHQPILFALFWLVTRMGTS
ncbi:heparan-alpha-glucosaminide N-acetyltransferase [Aureimonas sp. SK2]|uniref:heparan-alpha-glucosaminide N-acetyltransferase n=1 Tax=Aureimonas sp. SK2 TaxID=3015992 RepID=UPI0024439DF8|nr:heparan-alpha-glucosaminide N-acetyltransferase [Aureimonas sp. SK2]